MSIACCLVALWLRDGGDARAGILAVVQGPGDTPFPSFSRASVIYTNIRGYEISRIYGLKQYVVVFFIVSLL